MKKYTLVSDTFERAKEELIEPTAKGVTQAIKDTFNPKTMLEQAFGFGPKQDKEQLNQLEKKMKNKSTPLDLKKLQEKYQKQDQTKAVNLSRRFFERVKSEDEKALEKLKQKKQQEKQVEDYQKAEKEKKAKEEMLKAQAQITPRGKVRRSIFSAKKVAQREHLEVKPASGKQ